MSMTLDPSAVKTPIHDWLRKVNVTYVKGPGTPLIDSVVSDLMAYFQKMGHTVEEKPGPHTDVILTSALFGEPLSWRRALLFTARRQYDLDHNPTVITIVHVMPEEFERSIDHFDRALANEEPDPKDYDFPGLADDSYRVLHEQGRRGGPILALERVLQAQSKSIRVLLLVGTDRPEKVFHFDLVGAHPVSEAQDRDAFYLDIVLRIVTSVSTREVVGHRVVGEPISADEWGRLTAPLAMRQAAAKLGERNFFTDMIRIADLVSVPAVSQAVSSQYSEGCFATWGPTLKALIATVTGSARPVNKGNITDADLAVIVGVRTDGQGALVRHVEGQPNDPPSSEAVELLDMDSLLPKIVLPDSWGISTEVPVIRSKLHGHRGVSAYDPSRVEHVPLDPPYYHYPVTCATEAQAVGIKQAFARSEALNDPHDPRQVVFTILPGHGVVIVEKWVEDKRPFQVIWEFMDEGYLRIDNRVPQGLFRYELGADSKRELEWVLPG